MRLLKQTQPSSPNLEQLDLDINTLHPTQLTQHITDFQPDVIFALSDDENESVLELGIQHCCNMGFFKPQKFQLDQQSLTVATQKQIAKIFFLPQNSPFTDYFAQFGKVIHHDYLAECTQLIYLIFYADHDAFEP